MAGRRSAAYATAARRWLRGSWLLPCRSGFELAGEPALPEARRAPARDERQLGPLVDKDPAWRNAAVLASALLVQQLLDPAQRAAQGLRIGPGAAQRQRGLELGSDGIRYGCGSFITGLDGSKNDHLTSLSRGRRGGSGLGTTLSV